MDVLKKETTANNLEHILKETCLSTYSKLFSHTTTNKMVQHIVYYTSIEITLLVLL